MGRTGKGGSAGYHTSTASWPADGSVAAIAERPRRGCTRSWITHCGRGGGQPIGGLWQSPQSLRRAPTFVCLGDSMGRLTSAVCAPDQIAYVDAAASTAVGSDYKERFVASLDVRPEQTVTDIGCGPGTDLARLADAVGGTGSVIGAGKPRMMKEARHCLAGQANPGIGPCGITTDLPRSVAVALRREREGSLLVRFGGTG